MTTPNPYLISALEKLNIPAENYASDYKFQALSNDVNSMMWNIVLTPPHNLSIFELGALQNARCGSTRASSGPTIRAAPEGPTITAAPKGKVRYHNVTIQSADEYDGSADIYDVNNVQISGLVARSTKVSTMRLFMRKEVKDLWRRLEECPQNAKVLVRGCPGVGKSMIVFAQTMEHCLKHRRSLLYYHKDALVEACFVMDRDGQVHVVTAPKTKLPSTVLKLRHKYDVTVVDGTHKEITLKDIFSDFPSKKKLIICTSYQVTFVKGEGAYKLRPLLKKFTVASWSLEDYVAAAKARVFQFLQEQDTTSTPNAGEEEGESETNVDHIIQKRFYLCGGSIRFFCDDQNDARDSIDDAISLVPDYAVLFNNRVGGKSMVAVNTLMALYHEGNEIRSLPLSRYVFETLADRCGDNSLRGNFIARARTALPHNPSWQGWVTEYEVLFMLKVTGKLIVHSEANGIATSTLSCTEFIELQQDELSSSSSSSSSLKAISDYKPNTWIIPKKWNQALWYALQILDNDVLGVRQITSGETHTNKLGHLIPVTDALMPASEGRNNIKKVHFLTICRKSNFENFTYQNIDEERLSSKGIQVTFQKVWYEELVPNTVSTVVTTPTEPAKKKRRLGKNSEIKVL